MKRKKNAGYEKAGKEEDKRRNEGREREGRREGKKPIIV